MKRLLIALLMSLPLVSMAQDNTWERQPVTDNANSEQKYLAGAVPVVNGKVLFETTIQAPGKSGQQIYDIMKSQLTRLTKEEGQSEQSRLTLDDPAKLQLVATTRSGSSSRTSR